MLHTHHSTDCQRDTKSPPSSRHVVINADDLGACEEVNEAIAEAHRHGILTSASLMGNGPAFEHALESVIEPNPSLGVGAHLCLSSGESCLPAQQLPDLVDVNGRFRHGFVSLFHRLRSRPPGLLRQVEAELDAQLAHIHNSAVPVHHVDGHRYIHMIPAVFEITLKLSATYGCRWVRIPHESTRVLSRWPGGSIMWRRCQNLPKQQLLAWLSRRNSRHRGALHEVDRFHGILDSGAVTRTVLHQLLRHVPVGVTEIVTHPATPLRGSGDYWGPGYRRFVASPNRQRELTALLDAGMPRHCEREGLILTSFRDLSPLAEAPRAVPKPHSKAILQNRVRVMKGRSR